MNPVQFISQLTFQEFLKASFYTAYRQPIMIFLSFLGLLALISPPIYYFGVGPAYAKMSWTQLAIALYVLAFVPALIYFKCRKAFKPDSRLTERMDWVVDDVWMSVKGTSFETKMTWEKLHRVVETKEVFLVYQNKVRANIISKREMSEGQVQAFRAVVKGVLGLKHKLREG